MIKRQNYLQRLSRAVKRSPVTALLGPRQCGKTTLARQFGKKEAVYFDLESQPDVRRLANPELVLQAQKGLVVLDEIQLLPELFSVLRVLVDKPGHKARYLILGSASPELIRNASQTLAGRVEFVELTGFDLTEVKSKEDWRLWVRGGFPRSLLAASDRDSFAWRDGFVRTFLERDLGRLGLSIASSAMRRFWTMLAHHHGGIWNASAISRSLGVSDKTVRSYLDILTSTFMIRQLQPWHENIGKRQVKSPKIYFRDSGLLHFLLNIPDAHTLWGHPAVGASWEGFALEETLRLIHPTEAFFWATHNKAELDLFFSSDGKRYGVEFKLNEAPAITPSIHIAVRDLGLSHLWIVYPGKQDYPVDDKISVCSIYHLATIKAAMDGR